MKKSLQVRISEKNTLTLNLFSIFFHLPNTMRLFVDSKIYFYKLENRAGGTSWLISQFAVDFAVNFFCSAVNLKVNSSLVPSSVTLLALLLYFS